MSYQNFKEAMELAPQCKFYTTVGGRIKEEIQRSKELLQLKFFRQCTEFYEKYGYMSFFGTENFGIDPDDDSGELEENSVAYALHDREEYNLPANWLPLYDFEDGNMAYLVYFCLNVGKEPRVIMGFYNGSEYEVADVLAEDVGEFIL